MNKSSSQNIKEKLLKIAKNEIRISYSEVETSLSKWDSKIGGKPAVPHDFIWPEYLGEDYDGERKSRPLSFMAQINLKDVAVHDTENLLPKTGVLSFFYEQVSMTWGFDPLDKGSAKVYYFPDETELSLREFPLNIDKESIVPELALTFNKKISLPDFSSYPYKDSDLDWDEYYECRSELGSDFDEWGESTKLLGYPDVIQSPMEEECERVSRGYRCGSSEDYQKVPQRELLDIKEKANDWILLFQMGTISAYGFELMFGDCGHIYFWIRKSDLKACKFDDVWLIMQCC